MKPEVQFYCVQDSYNDGQGARWEVYIPWQGRVDVTDKDGTRGHNYAFEISRLEGYEFRSFGGQNIPGSALPPFNPAFGRNADILRCDEPLKFGDIAQAKVTLGAITYLFNGFTGAAVTVGSVMASDILARNGGQFVVGPGIDYGWLFKPQYELPIDPAGPVQTASHVTLPSIVMCNADGSIRGTGYPVCVDCAEGDAADMNFAVREPNGGQVSFVVKADAATAKSFSSNVEIEGAHNYTESAIRLGGNAYANTRIFKCRIGVTASPKNGTRVIDTWGRRCTFVPLADRREGVADYGVVYESGAYRNTVLGIKSLDVGAGILDASGASGADANVSV